MAAATRSASTEADASRQPSASAMDFISRDVVSSSKPVDLGSKLRYPVDRNPHHGVRTSATVGDSFEPYVNTHFSIHRCCPTRGRVDLIRVIL